MRARTVLAGAALLLIAACEPDYSSKGAQPTQVEPMESVTGGADPTSMSGRVKPADEPNIQHPNADGNAGRPPDGPGAPQGYKDSTGAHADA
ncbi:MAG TPA: hypothetical protein VFO96_06190 [Gemmatimonadales bacterium]|jgi:hypothetical protein|nr:hypothetical protein [Gemmatimonadales bacterium]